MKRTVYDSYQIFIDLEIVTHGWFFHLPVLRELFFHIKNQWKFTTMFMIISWFMKNFFTLSKDEFGVRKKAFKLYDVTHRIQIDDFLSFKIRHEIHILESGSNKKLWFKASCIACEWAWTYKEEKSHNRHKLEETQNNTHKNY